MEGKNDKPNAFRNHLELVILGGFYFHPSASTIEHEIWLIIKYQKYQ